MVEPASDNLPHRASLAFAQSLTRQAARPATIVANKAGILASEPNDVSRAILNLRCISEAEGALARALDRM